MEVKNDEVVRESKIFAALSPQSYSRRDRVLDLAGSTSTDTCSLPLMNPRDTSSSCRAPLRAHMTSLCLKTPQSLMMSVSMTTSESWLVWNFLSDWLKTQLAMEVPAMIPGLGTFHLRTQSSGSRIVFFEPDKKFLSKFGVQIDSKMVDPALLAMLSSTVIDSDALEATDDQGKRVCIENVVESGDVFAFSFVEMAACCGNAIDAAKAQEWLNVVIHKLGAAMNGCGRVELNIGVGVIVCVDRVIQRQLLLYDSRLFPQFECTIRTGKSIVKQNLRAQAAVHSAPRPSSKFSFLSGAAFSCSIQLNPVFDRTKDLPDFSFKPLHPRRPASTSVLTTSNSRASRSAQLQKKCQRSVNLSANRVNTSVLVLQAPENEESRGQSDEASPIVPQLFDRLCRTLCVEPDQNTSYLLPSNRIGSNFSKAAACLMTERSASQLGRMAQHSGGLVFIEKVTGTSFSSQRQRKRPSQASSSEQQYFEYLVDDNLIHHSYLAPLFADVEARIVTASLKCIVKVSSDRINKVLEKAHQGFVDNYYIGAKKAILDYLLMREESCDRLGISQGVPAHVCLPLHWKWGSIDGPHGCIADLKFLAKRSRRRGLLLPKHTKTTDSILKPEVTFSTAARRKQRQSKLMSMLILSNPQVQALHYMWHDLYASILLVDLPSIESLNGVIEPMNMIEFERKQFAHSAKVKAFVMENWYTKTRMMFESALCAKTFSMHTSEAAATLRFQHLFDTVATIMSLQIRSLIVKSIHAYVSFFERFGKVNANDQGGDSKLRIKERSIHSGLLTALVLRDGQIQFRDSLEEIPSRLLNVLHDMPKLFYNVDRIETQFKEPIVLSNTLSPFLWNVSLQEDEIAVATMQIRAIVEDNVSHLRKLQTDYDIFALTHRCVNLVDCAHLEENSELETYRIEMERVQATAMRLAFDCRPLQHLGLFSVDCCHANTKLLTELSEWMVRLLQAFEQRTSQMNVDLCQQYKDIAAQLAIKPLDLYELVDAEAFIKSLKKTKLQELQDKGDTIKQRLRFLLFEREKMHIGNNTIGCSPNALENNLECAKETPSTGFRLSADLLSSSAKSIRWQSHIDSKVHEAKSLLVNERVRIEAMLIVKKTQFQAEVEEFEREVDALTTKRDLRHAATYIAQLTKMHDSLVLLRQTHATIIQEEQKLQWKSTEFGKLDDIAEVMAPYLQLWKIVKEFREMNTRWLRSNIMELPGKEGLEILQQMRTDITKVSHVLLSNAAVATMTVETVRKQMIDFYEHVRLIVAIQNPAMKDHHMKAVSELVGIDLGSNEVVTLLRLLENGSFEMIDSVVDISCKASQEEQSERVLNDISSA